MLAHFKLLVSVLVLLASFKFLREESVVYRVGSKESKQPDLKPDFVLVAMVCGDGEDCPFSFRNLENLIGSLHKFRHVDGNTGLPTIHVYGYNLTEAKITQIHLWKGVNYISVNHAFPDMKFYDQEFEVISGGKSINILSDGRLRRAILERAIGDHGSAVYLSANYIFDGYIMGKLARDLGVYGHVRMESKDEVILQGASSSANLDIAPTDLLDTEYWAKMPSRDPNLRCLILQRRQFAHYHLLHDGLNLKVGARTIVIGAPTTSRATACVEGHPVHQILFPNMKAAAEANPDVHFVLLIAFDAKDRFLDDEDMRKLFVMKDPPSNMSIKFIRLIKTGSVVMIWNALYDIAMKSGARYFYQLNDDITFNDLTWPESFMNAIDSQNGHGVVGPNDVRRQCNLLTQNFVGRGHWEIFGFLFPAEFRNWWCDNWIGALYQLYGIRKCFKYITIVNGRRSDGSRSRYRPCQAVEYTGLLAYHAEMIERFLTALDRCNDV